MCCAVFEREWSEDHENLPKGRRTFKYAQRVKKNGQVGTNRSAGRKLRLIADLPWQLFDPCNKYVTGARAGRPT
jgi:hypothetical protein